MQYLSKPTGTKNCREIYYATTKIVEGFPACGFEVQLLSVSVGDLVYLPG